MPADINLDEYVPAVDSIATFSFAGTTYRVYASLRNEQPSRDVRLWQFRYEPVFLPQGNSDGSLNFKIADLRRLWQLQLPIALYTPETDRLAYEAVLKAFPAEKASQIIRTNVTALNVSSIGLEIPHLSELVPSAIVPTESIELFATAAYFTLSVFAPTKEAIDEVASVLPNLRVRYTITFAAKTLQQNSLEIKRKDLKTSRLYATLDGLPPAGSTTVYVHRDDFRKLSEGLSTSISVNGMIENPERFDATLSERILASMATSVTADSASFNEAKWKATYNGDDLKPDVITEALNKMFSKVENEDQWKYSGSLSVGGKVNVLDVLGAESNVAGSYSQEGLRKKLEQHDIESSFKGNKIEAKSIKVSQLNLSDFSSEQTLASINTFISNLRAPKQGSLDLSLAGGGATFLALAQRFERLEDEVSKHVPVGTLMPFAGLVDPVQKLPVGWLLCDGRSILKTEYAALYTSIGELYGKAHSDLEFNLPNFSGRTIIGTGTYTDDVLGLLKRELGASFGTASTQLTVAQLPSHIHNVTGSTGERIISGFAMVRQLGDTDGVGHHHDFSVASGAPNPADTRGEPHPNMMPCLAVNVLIRY